MSLNRRTALDPRWVTHHRSVPQGFMAATISITRMNDPTVGWDPISDELVKPATFEVWSGQARVQPNKDWRARNKMAGADPVVMHAMRVQIPLLTTPEIEVNDAIRVLECRADPLLNTYVFRVRNPVGSSNGWVRNMLCDIDIEEPYQ